MVGLDAHSTYKEEPVLVYVPQVAAEHVGEPARRDPCGGLDEVRTVAVALHDAGAIGHDHSRLPCSEFVACSIDDPQVVEKGRFADGRALAMRNLFRRRDGGNPSAYGSSASHEVRKTRVYILPVAEVVPSRCRPRECGSASRWLAAIWSRCGAELLATVTARLSERPLRRVSLLQ